MYTGSLLGLVSLGGLLENRARQSRIKHCNKIISSLDQTNRHIMNKNELEIIPMWVSPYLQRVNNQRINNSGGGNDERIDHDSSYVAITEKPKLQKPPLYKVVLINDDYTPMDFVVEVLCSFFAMNVEKATQIMLKVHTEGKGVCGVFGKDVAETKAAQVNEYAQECEQPLLCSVEVDR